MPQPVAKPLQILVINVHSTLNAGDHVLLHSSLAQLRQNFPGCTLTLAINDPQSVTDSEWAADSARGSHEMAANAVGSFTHWFKQSGSTQSAWRRGNLLLAPLLLGGALLAALLYRLTGVALLPLLGAEQRRLLRAYLAADLVVSCAGNFFYSSGALSAGFLLHAGAFAYAWLLGKPIYTMPQTLGPLHRRWEHVVLRAVLRRARLLLVRDERSLALLQQFQLDSGRTRLLPDIAFLFDSDPSPAEINEETLLRSHGVERDGQPLLGITVINWGAQNQRFRQQAAYEAAVALAIREFVVGQGGRALLFPQVRGPRPPDDDRVPARRVAARLRDLGERVILIESEVSPSALKRAYGQTDLFLGSRLHSNIFALTEGVPVVAIAYQPKTHGTLRLLGLEQWVIDIEAARGDAVARLVKQLWRERAAVRDQLAQVIPQIQREAAQAGRWIREDFERAAAAAAPRRR